MGSLSPGSFRLVHGSGRWRKRKGVARVELNDGSIRLAELHRYEAHGTKLTALVDMSTRSKATSTRSRLVVCLSNEGYEVSLEPRKIYAVLPDAGAAKHDQLRVIDESGEDYLFPASLFARITLRGKLREAVLAAI